jgi:hypothetical protein
MNYQTKWIALPKFYNKTTKVNIKKIMETNNNQETNQQNNLTEFDNEKPTRKQPNTTLSVIIGVFFVGYGIFRLTNNSRAGGSWNYLIGGAMIGLGIIRILSVTKKN